MAGLVLVDELRIDGNLQLSFGFAHRLSLPEGGAFQLMDGLGERHDGSSCVGIAAGTADPWPSCGHDKPDELCRSPARADGRQVTSRTHLSCLEAGCGADRINEGDVSLCQLQMERDRLIKRTTTSLLLERSEEKREGKSSRQRESLSQSEPSSKRESLSCDGGRLG